MKKTMVRILVAGATVLALVACGGQESAATSTGDVEAQEQETATEDTATEDATTEGGTTTSTSAPADSAEQISEDEAKQIAFSHAGVSEADCTELGVELDYDYGTQIYEVDFKVGIDDYEYDIDAVTGEIYKAEHEVDNA